MNINMAIEDGLTEMGLQFDNQFVCGLADLLEQLVKWNKTYNLTAIRDPAQIITHHIFDSLSVQAHVKGANIIDVGSGAGFPGLPLALYFPEKNFTLLDSNGKKTRFLQQVKIVLGLKNCRIVQSRAEVYRETFDQVICRAFASLADITEKTAHLLSCHGEILALKGKLDEAETRSDISPFQITTTHLLAVPQVGAERHLVILKKKS
ncbi:MAG TPA: 16S rRNA (guanine(527)-N(7))-methyltransferase RsmG [Gammaproteobacteria bacterium]|nr:16S rRNA (guanine(527)-N(7))-methyltransferase RsmG [Gammaproteobacteria bacterium]HIL95174.1 16S rRNA (guanine(527)-N(7))-methyltransferase RsmG [Pseudomonadales bacterium]